MNALGWVLFVGCMLGAAALGYAIRVLQDEVREFAAEQARDEAWDRKHGIGR